VSKVLPCHHLSHGRRFTKEGHTLGYYVSVIDARWHIPAENVEAAYRAACALNDRDDLKSGGRYVKGYPDGRPPRPEGLNYHPGAWFGNADSNYPDKCADLVEVLTHWGFNAYMSEPGYYVGSVWIEGYDGKSTDEEYLLAALAPFTEEGAYLDWHGDDGEMWRYEVRAGLLHYLTGSVKWTDGGVTALKFYRGQGVEV
jgi:hypothetical protein